MVINNPHAMITKEEDLRDKKGEIPFRYFINGFERGEEEDTPHLQCFFVLKKPQRFTYLKKIFGNECHFEIAHCDDDIQCAEYCMKDNNYWEYGHLSRCGPGARTDIYELRDAIANGICDLDIVMDDRLLGPWMRYQRAVTSLRALFETPPTRDDTRVCLIYGAPGTGKSRFVRDNFPNAYWKDNSKWWPGYTGQDTVIWDEFGGWSCTPYQYNSIFDKYPTWVEPKGNAVPLRATNFIIISNFKPEQWWNQQTTTVNIDAVTRRLGLILWFKKLGEEAEEFHSYEEFAQAQRPPDINIWRAAHNVVL